MASPKTRPMIHIRDKTTGQLAEVTTPDDLVALLLDADLQRTAQHGTIAEFAQAWDARAADERRRNGIYDAGRYLK